MNKNNGGSHLSPSILMSSGPSLLREKPRSALSICIDEQPASNRAASTLRFPKPSPLRRSLISLKRPRTGLTWPL